MANNSPSSLGAADLAAATPVDRDRYADLLRLFSIGMVAVGHWVVALLTLHGAGAVGTSMPVREARSAVTRPPMSCAQFR